MSDPHELVTVAMFGSVGEAEVARMTLEADGVKCYLADAETVNMMWFASNAVGGVKLQVAAEDAPRAQRLLAQHRPRDRGRNVDDYGLEKPQRGSPDTGEADEADDEPVQAGVSADVLVSRAWRAAIIGLVLCPPVLHIWSLCLLAQAVTQQAPVSEQYRGKMTGAAVIDVAALLLIGSLWPMWSLLFS
jgi:hypothetical protein